jgi:hypothetical protein
MRPPPDKFATRVAVEAFETATTTNTTMSKSAPAMESLTAFDDLSNFPLLGRLVVEDKGIDSHSQKSNVR